MKYLILFIAFLKIAFVAGQSNTVNYKIDPRHYITIYETNGLRVKKEPIWYMVKRNISINTDETVEISKRKAQSEFFTFQKHFVIAENSLLEIYFNQDSLAKNINFYGGISLMATVGERKIEVNPYYVIGENQETYGVKSKPIKEIADYFLRLMIESSKVNENYLAFNKTYNEIKVDYKEVSKSINEATSILQQSQGQRRPADFVYPNFYFSDLRRVFDDILNSLNESNIYKIQLSNFIARPESFTYEQIQKTLKECSNNLGPYNVNIDRATETRSQLNKLLYENDQNNAKENAENLYKLFYNSALRVQQLIGAINKGDINASDKTLKSFLNLTLLTLSDFNTINADLNLSLSKIKDYPNLQDIVSANKQLLVELTNINSSIAELTKGGIELTEILKKRDYNDKFKKNSNENLLYDNPDDYKLVRNELAEKAGREIFRDLIMGTIDIGRSDIRNGDLLEISVVWDSKNNANDFNNSNLDAKNLVQKNRLPLAKFLIKKTGWHLDVSESALLIHRIDEEKLRSGYPLSPSNFKPTAGASLLWSYYNPYRTERLKKTGKYKGQYKEYGFLKFLHWLEPSFGINVSYLDFRTDRDFEFGAGPVMGLFQNRIFLTTGYNFSVNGESPFYMGIGFSFSNIYKRINKADND
jgi:hypothetical protein